MKRRLTSASSSQVAGEDSFLDILANIVGILILLVVVVGVRASQYASGPIERSTAPPDLAVSDEAVRNAQRKARTLLGSVEEIAQQILALRTESMLRDQERVELNTFIKSAETELETTKLAMDVEDRRDFDLRQQINRAKLTLDELTRQQVALLAQPVEVVELKNSPTPIAKSAAEKRVHVRLHRGAVSVVPVDELMELVEARFREDRQRLNGPASTTTTVGPVDGFRMRYASHREKFTQRGRRGEVIHGTGNRISTAKVLPVVDVCGDPVDEAIQDGSLFLNIIRTNHPGKTDIIVWTYENSFEFTSRLKQKLHEMGYPVAVRPLPNGGHIGFSTTGTRAYAQ